jgi:hypothetical protein
MSSRWIDAGWLAWSISAATPSSASIGRSVRVLSLKGFDDSEEMCASSALSGVTVYILQVACPFVLDIAESFKRTRRHSQQISKPPAPVVTCSSCAIILNLQPNGVCCSVESLRSLKYPVFTTGFCR